MSKKKPIVDDHDQWKNNLESAKIQDSDFQIIVAIMDPCGASTLDQLYLEKFEKYSTFEKRSVIKNISKTETIFMINQLGRDKNLKTAPSHKVYEKAYEHLQEHKELSSELTALTIKQQLLMLKDHYKTTQKMKAELKEGLAQESRTMLEKNALKRATSKTLSKHPDGTGDAPDEEDKKYSTSLRLRGEDWRDKIYVDDYPLDGSNLYIIITNFMDPYLPSCLIRIGIKVTAIVQVRIDPISDNSETRSPRLEPVEFFKDYWNNVQFLRTQQQLMDIYKNIIYFIFAPPHPFSPKQEVSDDPEVVYDEISFLLYDIQDVTRQHRHYLNNLEVIEVSSNVIDNISNMYLQKRVAWPLECFTISLVLENILEVIDSLAATDKKSDTTSTKSNTKDTNRDLPEIDKEEGFIHKVIDTLSQESKLKKCFNVVELPKIQNIFILPHYNYTKYIAHHIDLNDFLVGVTDKMLEKMPLPNLWSVFSDKSISRQAKQNYHRNILVSCFDRNEINWMEISRLLNLLGFQKIFDYCRYKSRSYSEEETFSELKRKKLKRSNLVEAFPNISTTRIPSEYSANPIKIPSAMSDSSGNDPYASTVRFMFECSGIGDLISPPVLEKSSDSMNVIEHYEYYEELDISSSLQIMDKCFKSFNLVAYKYCEVTDCLLIMFYNCLNDNSTFNEEWTTHLNTPVCLQDFFDFVVDEHYDWIKNDDIATDEMLQTHELPSSDSGTHSNYSCLDNTDRGVDLLMEGSIKYAELTEQCMGELNNSSCLLTKKPIGTKSQDGLNTCNENPSSNLGSDKDDSRILKKSFYGFDLGGRRIEISGKNCEWSSQDGSKVNVKFSTFFPYNLECLYACIASGDGKKFIYVYNNMFCKYDSSLERVMQITSADEFMINFYKTKRYLNNSGNFHSNETTESNFGDINFDAVITWPNGLIIQLERDNDSGLISYVKQRYSKLPMPINYMNVTEIYRCINKYGETVIFLSNDTIKVLCHDSKIIYIDKYERVPISTFTTEDQISTLSQTNLKTSKGKFNRQITSQSLKQTFSNISFDIVFTDFSITDHDGTRNRYTGKYVQNKSKLLVRETLDVNLGEIFIRRTDDTTSYWNDEGIHIVTFPDGTRIITQYVVEDDELFAEWTEEEIQILTRSSHTNDLRFPPIVESNTPKDGNVMIPFTEGFISIHLVFITEKDNYATVITKPQGNLITIENPNNTLSVLRNNEYEWFSDKSSAVITNDHLCYTYKSCLKCDLTTTCKVHLTESSASDPKDWIIMKDLFSKKISVSKEGIIKKITKRDNGDSNNSFEDISNQSELLLCSCCGISDIQKRRFFVMKRDLSVSELLSKREVESNLEKISSLPWCSLTKHNAFNGYRGLQTILSPLLCNQTQKWTMSSKFAKKPKRLTYKHFEKVCNKGFYKWMRPYKRFQTSTNNLPLSTIPELPNAFIFRAYEHIYAKAEDNQELIGGNELIMAIKKYYKVMKTQCEILVEPDVDTRSEEEIKLDTTLQDIANKTAREICKNLTNVQRENFVPDITSGPTIDTRSLNQESSFYTPSLMSREEDMRSLIIEAIIDKVPSNAAYNKYWAQRAADKKEEAFLLLLLRNKHVPAYFSSELEFLKDGN